MDTIQNDRFFENDIFDLMLFFEIKYEDELLEFWKFWDSLSDDEKVYYRQAPLK